MERASCRTISYSKRNPGRKWVTLPDSRTACSSSAALTKLLQESPWYSAALAALHYQEAFAQARSAYNVLMLDA